jgi:hypothetical protein
MVSTGYGEKGVGRGTALYSRGSNRISMQQGQLEAPAEEEAS